MKRYFIIALLSCTFVSANPNNPPSSEHVKIAYKLRAQTISQIEKYTPLRSIGVGGALMDNVEMLSISFEHKGLLTFDEAKKLALFCADLLIKNVNSSKKIRPYLANYPFNYGNIDVAIYIHNPDGSDIGQGNLSGIAVDRSQIKYYDFTLPLDECVIKKESLLVDQKSSPEPTDPPKSSD